MRKIRVTVEFPWATVPDVVEYYDVPDDWDELAQSERDSRLAQMGAEELANTGVGYGATVVDEAGNEVSA